MFLDFDVPSKMDESDCLEPAALKWSLFREALGEQCLDFVASRWYESIELEESFLLVVIMYFSQFLDSDVKFGLRRWISNCRRLSRPVFDRFDL